MLEVINLLKEKAISNEYGGFTLNNIVAKLNEIEDVQIRDIKTKFFWRQFFRRKKH